jgi:hypothetical protein
MIHRENFFLGGERILAPHRSQRVRIEVQVTQTRVDTVNLEVAIKLAVYWKWGRLHIFTRYL